MDAETRDTLLDLTDAVKALVRNAQAAQLGEAQTRDRIDSLERRVNALQAALRALAADPGEVADAILKVVRDE